MHLSQIDERAHALTHAARLSRSDAALRCVRHEATWAGVVARDWLLPGPSPLSSQSALSQRRQFASEPDGGGPERLPVAVGARLRAEAGLAATRTGLKFTSDGLGGCGPRGAGGDVRAKRAGELGVTPGCWGAVVVLILLTGLQQWRYWTLQFFLLV